MHAAARVAPASGRPVARREPWAPTVVVVVGLLAAYLPTLAPAPTFNDGPEITTAIDRLGVIHPTGYPIFTVLAHVFTRLVAVPLPVLVKVELFNALSAVGAGLLAARATRELVLGTRARALLPEGARRATLSSTRLAELVAALPARTRRAARFGGMVAGLLLGWSPLLWAQVRIPEVYAFHVLLVAWAFATWVRFETTRQEGYVVRAALPMGMGLAHHVTMVFMLPAALLLVLLRRPSFFTRWLVAPLVRIGRLVRPRLLGAVDLRGAWLFPLACLVGALPLASYGYLLWANAHTDGVSWGGVGDLSGVWDHMTGKQYRRFTEARELDSYWRRIAKLPTVFDQQFTPSGALLFLAGLAAAARRAPAFCLFAVAYLALNVAHGVHYAVGDYANYYLPAVLAASVLIGVGASWAHGRASVLGLMARVARPALRSKLGSRAVPRLLAVALVVVTLPAVVERGRAHLDEPSVGGSYGEDVTSTIPPGGLLLTQGDGYLFTMWHEHHVLGRGLDMATLDMGNLKTPWYQRYLRGHHPDACDPLAPGAWTDPVDFASRCGTFRARIDQGARHTWMSLGLSRGGTRRRPVKNAEPIVRGTDPRCLDASFAKANAADCRCWGYGERAGAVEAHCVHAAEEGGIAPRSDLDIMAHRIIEDEIDVRPVFERNVFTHWWNDGKLNPRGWKGPATFRPSGRYDLLNRGRVNQIVHHADLEPHADPCGSETGRPVALRPLREARKRKRQAPRELYVPNDRPTLVTASYLTPDPAGDDDDATRRFTRGQAVHLDVDWFEKFAFDARKRGRRGAPIREGVRLCVFDPAGRRVAVETIVSGAALGRPLLETTAASAAGRYLVQGCSVGDVGSREPPYDELRCRRIILELELDLAP